MKTSEAKTKVCPFMSVNNPEVTGYTYCVCGYCMAWKWKETYEKKTSIQICNEKFSLPKEGGWKSLGYDKRKILWAERYITSRTEGFCKRLENE